MTNPSTGDTWSTLYLTLGLEKLGTEKNTDLTLSYQDTSGGWCPLTPITVSGVFTYEITGVGSSCAASDPASFSLAPGGSLTVPMELSYATGTYLGAQAATATLYSGTCATATTCTQSGSLDGNVVTTGTIEVAPLAPVGSTVTDLALGRLATESVRQGFNVTLKMHVAATAPTTGLPKPTGTVSYLIDGSPVTVVLNSGGAPVSSVAITGATSNAPGDGEYLFDTANLALGTHTLTANYSGDDVYAPSSLTQTFTVLPPLSGTPFTCTETGTTYLGYVTATGTLPSATVAGTSAFVNNLNVTLDLDPAGAYPTLNATPQEPVTFSLSPGGTANSAAPPTFSGQTGTVNTGTWAAMSGSIPVTGTPGSTVTAGVGRFSYTYSGGTFGSATLTCAPVSQAAPIGTVTVAGTTLTASPAGAVTQGSTVTLTATVAPAPATNAGTVQFFDDTGSGLSVLGVANVSTGAAGEPAAGTAVLTVPATVAGTNTYSAQWSGTVSIPANTSNTLSYTVTDAPTVTAQPTGQTVTDGHTATFVATADGTPTPTVQWEVLAAGATTWTIITGATTDTYTTPATTSADDQSQYEAVFTNGAGSVTTSPATLTVDYAPTVTTQPANQASAAGQPVTFSAAAAGEPAPTVQWQISTDGGATFSNISGATSPTLTFTGTAADSGNQYRAVFTNNQGTVTTNPAILAVATAPSVTTQPSDQAVTAGQPATFGATASGVPSPSVQWQVSADGGSSWATVPGGTSPTLSVPTPSTTTGNGNGNQYRAVFTNSAGSATTSPATLTVTVSGYRLVGSDGSVFSFGDAQFYGSMGGKPLDKPVVGAVDTPTGGGAASDGATSGGYWEVASDGGIFAFGDAQFYGSMGGKPLNKPIVGMAATPTGGGYWEVASDGGIFAFGDAQFYGSMGGKPLNQPIVGMAATPTGGGYWLVASDGGIFSFGAAQFLGSTGSLTLNKPIVSMAATPTGGGAASDGTASGGYWLVASDGGIFSFGDAAFYGSTGGQPLSAPIVAMQATPTGQGYWEVGSNGSMYAFGDAPLAGTAVGLLAPGASIVAITG